MTVMVLMMVRAVTRVMRMEFVTKRAALMAVPTKHYLFVRKPAVLIILIAIMPV